MTRADAIKELKEMRTDAWTDTRQMEALSMGIKALEQEPCNTDTCKVVKAYMNEWDKPNNSDAISRQAVLDLFQDNVSTLHNYARVWEAVEDTPSVTPSVNPQEPKTGHWIDDNENEIDAQYGMHLYKCSECNEYADMFVGGIEDWWDLEKPNYCPNCGCAMVEPQESEVSDADSN